jgi:dihydrofolate reductase
MMVLRKHGLPCQIPEILVAGSGKLVQTLMHHNLVDEYRFMVHPVVLGSGKRLFTEGTEKLKLTLVDTKSFKTGIVVLHYQPERHSKDK